MKRVICGVGPSGKNVVLYEGDMHRLGGGSGTEFAEAADRGETMYLAWAAPPGETCTEDDTAAVADGFELAPGETRFLRVEIAPGVEVPLHRTPYINDYLIALSGRLTMVMEDGSETSFEAGDMLVQLGGWHSWRNEGPAPFVMAGVVVGVPSDAQVPGGFEMAKA